MNAVVCQSVLCLTSSLVSNCKHWGAQMVLNHAQIRVAVGMVIGAMVAMVALYASIGGHWLPPLPDDWAGRTSVWMVSSLAVGSWVVVGIARLARHRFFTPEDIDGAGLTAGTEKVRLLQSILQNTLEQALIAVIAYGAWSYLAPRDWGALPLLCSLFFGVGRILFFVGYEKGAPARALGFTLTFYPTIGLYIALLPLIIRKFFLLL